MIYSIKRTGIHTQTKKPIRKNKLCMGTVFSGPGATFVTHLITKALAKPFTIPVIV